MLYDKLESMTKEEMLNYLKKIKLHTLIASFAVCEECCAARWIDDVYKYNDEYICCECASNNSKFIIVGNKVYKEYDLQKNVLVHTDFGYRKIHKSTFGSALTYFPPVMKNVEWYQYCFADFLPIKQNNLINFDRSNKNHMWLFKQCTRFNYYQYYDGFGENCFRYNTNDETSVEQILDNIVTLRIIMIKYRVPRCLRDYIISFYLKF